MLFVIRHVKVGIQNQGNERQKPREQYKALPLILRTRVDNQRLFSQLASPSRCLFLHIPCLLYCFAGWRSFSWPNTTPPPRCLRASRPQKRGLPAELSLFPTTTYQLDLGAENMRLSAMLSPKSGGTQRVDGGLVYSALLAQTATAKMPRLFR